MLSNRIIPKTGIFLLILSGFLLTGCGGGSSTDNGKETVSTFQGLTYQGKLIGSAQGEFTFRVTDSSGGGTGTIAVAGQVMSMTGTVYPDGSFSLQYSKDNAWGSITGGAGKATLTSLEGTWTATVQTTSNNVTTSTTSSGTLEAYLEGTSATYSVNALSDVTYPNFTYTFYCADEDPLVAHSKKVHLGPCQQAEVSYVTAVGCNTPNSDLTFKIQEKALYQCAADYSTLKWKTYYQQVVAFLESTSSP